MLTPTSSKNQTLLQTILYAIIFLFFFQLIADFVEAVYAFGLLGTSIPPEIASVLFLFSPLILLLLPKGLSGWPLVAVGELMLASRVAYPLLDTRGKMLVAGFGAACFLIFFPAILAKQKDEKPSAAALNLGVGLTIALSVSILLRALGSGVDISTTGWTQLIGWVLAIAAGWAIAFLYAPSRSVTGGRGSQSSPEHSRRIPSEHKETRADEQRDSPPSFWKVALLSIGSMGVLVTLYFSFTSPNVISRWTGASYPMIVAIIVAVLWLFARLLSKAIALTPAKILTWNILFALSLILTVLAYQINFPAEANSYPLAEPSGFWWYNLPLWFMLLLFPIVLIDFILFTQKLIAQRPSARMLGGGFLIASFFLAVMIFSQVFTTVYSYIPVIGPFFRDKFWFAFLLAGLSLILPLLAVDSKGFKWEPAPNGKRLLPATILILGLVTIIGLFLTAARPAAQPTDKTTLKILTYNIQQGYSEEGSKNLDGQLDLIREVDADVVGLQESDTNRIAGGNSDVVRYFADRLNLHSYYGPKTASGTFGVALLSKYPIQNPRAFYMFSEGEQTATIEAQIEVGGKTFNVFVTHLGNGGPIVQQEAIMQELNGQENVILMGDFNFKPDGEQYALTRSALDDAWLFKWPDGVDDQGLHPAGRIDHIFVSPGTAVSDARYLISPHSDHPAMMAAFQW